MLYSMNDPVEDDEDLDSDAASEGRAPAPTTTEQRTVTRHAVTGKFVKNAPTNPMHGKPTGKASGSGKKLVSGKAKGAGVKPATTGAPSGGSSKPGAMGAAKDGRTKHGRVVSGAVRS